MADSTAAPKKGKPRRKATRKDFPLWKHPRGYWCKKVAGQNKYFEKVADDPDGSESLVQWLDQKDDLLAGREPRDQVTGGNASRGAGGGNSAFLWNGIPDTA